ncbi:pyrimidine dimer DNA glycosylase/endonuclease V [Ancylomarina sp. 16SWW S1-10-2]|uniref:pyrimidine dimer DNA glycosylase/endonuclease V n=1 Tax=Ancylomarina sp. 16SWW S1-10-2 TaxID=2499681 RepID=UPI0012AD9A9C|nr:pyrimidine dimer DNA glycosylase/endonuclease V [Ancylomarina sp. 16SWW S1-10-2]MRT92705.1 hypothetical protein [Ancylomarina sp. 16SWW S1-10-2]
MRIWSLHPKYLDAKGLVALWRETLLAKNVLQGNTKGYKNHPQLIRFKATDNPLDRINQYLAEVYEEALRRNYNFNRSKIDWQFTASKIAVTDGQIQYEKEHLLKKLEVRDLEKFHILSKETVIELHPLFHLVQGDIEDWEIV